MNIIIEGDSTTSIKEAPSTTVISIDSVEKVTVENNVETRVVTNTNETLVVENTISGVLLSGGIQGPQGIPGESNTTLSMVAGSNLNGHTVVITDSNAKVVNPVVLADGDVLVGITTGAAIVDSVVEVQYTGTLVEPSWNWTLGLPIFVGPNGTLTQTPPSTGVLQIIAYPILSNRILIDKQQPITIG